MILLKIKNYYRATTIEDAYKVLLEDDSNIIIAGGAWLKQSKKQVNKAIDITMIGLGGITVKDDMIEIGAMASLREIETSELIKQQCNGILSEAINHIMGVGIRNIATLGGSVMGKYAFSDLFTPLLVMDASLVFYRQGEMLLTEFLKIKRMEKDILLKIILPKTGKIGYFHKVQKTRLDFAVVNVAISNDDSFVIAVGARPSIASIATKAMQFINNQKEITEKVIKETAKIAVEELKFSTNSKSSSEYRELVAETYIKRGLKEVISNES